MFMFSTWILLSSKYFCHFSTCKSLFIICNGKSPDIVLVHWLSQVRDGTFFSIKYSIILCAVFIAALLCRYLRLKYQKHFYRHILKVHLIMNLPLQIFSYILYLSHLIIHKFLSFFSNISQIIFLSHFTVIRLA